MNRGDAQAVYLNITVDGNPIDQYYADEIEVTFNPELHGHSVRKTLSAGDIYWDDEVHQYALVLSQEDTFILHPGNNTWQLRLMKDTFVVSTIIGKIAIGDVNSKRILVSE